MLDRPTVPGAGSRCPRIPPLSKPLHAALIAWLGRPGSGDTTSTLHKALDEYELRHRIRRSIAALPTPQGGSPLPLRKTNRKQAMSTSPTLRNQYIAIVPCTITNV